MAKKPPTSEPAFPPYRDLRQDAKDSVFGTPTEPPTFSDKMIATDRPGPWEEAVRGKGTSEGPKWEPFKSLPAGAIPKHETLFDLVQADLIRGEIDGLWLDDAHRRQQAAKMAERLRKAHRYVIDDDAAVLVAACSVGHFAALIAAMASTRPTFDALWFEYSPAAEIRAIGQEPATDVPPRAGILVERLSAEHPIYTFRCGGVAYHGEDMRPERGATFGIVEYLVDFSDTPQLTAAERIGFESSILEHIPEAKRDGWGMFGPDRSKLTTLYAGAATEVQASKVTGTPLRIMNGHKLIAFSERVVVRWQREQLKALYEVPVHLKHELSNVLLRALREEAGTARFVVAMLAFLTHRTQLLATDVVERRGRRLRHGRDLPYFGYSKIRVQLPREVALQRAIKVLRNEPAYSRRRHDVERHWCHRAKDRHGCGYWPSNRLKDPHDWEPIVEDKRYRCRRCDCKRWDQPEHKRGDAIRGWVHQTRVVTTKAHPNPPETATHD